MKCHELKIYFEQNEHPVTNNQIIEMIETQLRVPNSGIKLKVNPKNSRNSLAERIRKEYDCEVRMTITDDCYGARPGTSSDGFTVWLHPQHLTERYVDADLGEMVNPYHLLEAHGELVKDMDGEQFDSWVELFGLESKSDNTYNFSGQNSEDAQHMFDFQFTSVETPDNGLVVSIMFHCGGDPRCNYTSKFIYKFKYIEDFYSVIYPTKHLTSDEV